jgi:hypothetical protein
MVGITFVPQPANAIRTNSVKQALEPAALDDSEIFGSKNLSSLAYGLSVFRRSV